MVVGGVDAFVGSDRGQARAAIARALAQAPRTQVSVSAMASEGSSVRVSVHLEPALTDAVVRVAVVERGLVSHVTSGENSGRVLHHENVVRAFATVRVSGPDAVTSVSVPGAVDRSHADVIAFVQTVAGAAGPSAKGMPIAGAARAPLPLHR
jgi:hypothetical protein